MFSVIKNVFGAFVVHDSGLSLETAIEGCGDIIRDSHGGEAYVVSDADGEALDGQACDLISFGAFGVDGESFNVRGKDD